MRLARARSLGRAVRAHTDIDRAQAVVVVRADGSLTLVCADEMDRAVLAQALVELAFAQLDEITVPPALDVRRDAGSDAN